MLTNNALYTLNSSLIIKPKNFQVEMAKIQILYEPRPAEDEVIIAFRWPSDKKTERGIPTLPLTLTHQWIFYR